MLNRQAVLKLKLTLTIISLLLISMLLINFVLLLLWKHDALQREVKYDQAILSHIHSLLLQDKQGRTGNFDHQFAFSEYYDASEQGRFFFLLQAGKRAGQGEEAASRTARTTGISVSEESKITALLAGVARKAQHTGKPVSRTASVNPHTLLCNDLLLNAQPVVDQGEIIGAVAVVRSLDPLFLTLWQNEKTLLVYLVLNLLVLGVIAFFRMFNLVIRPVDHLVGLADQYRNYDPFQFTPENSGTEFGKLSKSLNSMLARIEDDRQSLQQTVTALEAANLTLKKQQQEMVRAEKLATVGRMAAGLAHEIGNPLSVVQGYVEMLLASKEQPENHRDFLCRSEQELYRIDTLIRQLLDFSRAAKGKPQLFSLHELLHSILTMIRTQTAFRDIALATDFAAENDQLYADKEQLRQVVVNCLLNSADAIHMVAQKDEKARKDGRIFMTTAVQCPLSQGEQKEEMQQLVLCIRDNGTGIATKNLALVFDPFFTTKEPGKGTGLGLSVSRSLVEAAGGTMELRTEIGQGSTMLLCFPLACPNKDNIPG